MDPQASGRFPWRTFGWILLFKVYGFLLLYLLFLKTDLRGGQLGFLFVRQGQPRAQRPLEIQEDFWQRLTPYDGQYYLDIASKGYRKFGAEDLAGGVHVPGNYAFFPILPALLAGMQLVSSSHGLHLTIILAIFLSSLGALVTWRIAAMVGIGPDSTVLLLLAFPTAVFQLVLYTEGIFLLLSSLALLHILKRSWTQAALWALLAGLCRPQGFLLAIPLLIEAIQSIRRERTWTLKAAGPRLLACSTPFSGYLALAAVSSAIAGSPLAFLDIQSSWGRSFEGGGFLQAISSAIGYDGPPFDVAGLIFGLGMLPFLWKRLPPSLAAYGTGMVVLPLLTGSLLSMGRFLSVSIPHFIGLAAILEKSPAIRYAVIGGCVILQVLLANGLIGWHFVG